MMRQNQLLEPLLQHVRVDLRRRDVGVAEQLLHGAQVGAAIEQMAGECKDVAAGGRLQHQSRCAA